MSTIKNVVLAHGGFVDGTGWEGVIALPPRRGFNVPQRGLAADIVAAAAAS